MIATIEHGAMQRGNLILSIIDHGRCKKMMQVPEGSSEEALLFYAWFLFAQALPGSVREHGLLNAGNMVLRALSEGGSHAEEATPPC